MDKDQGFRGRAGSQQAVEDPVCGMMISPDESEFSYNYEGETFFFCCEDCMQKFQEDPEQYVL